MAERTVLAVDDDPSALLYLKQILKNDGYRVMVAAGGREALEALDSAVPDLMLLDVQMPGMSGYDLLARVRRDERTSQVPVIFLTVKDTREDEVKGLREGVVDYLSKEVLTPDRVDILRLRLRNFFVWQENERLRGVLATMVSANHEINNPLMVIVGSAEVLRLRGDLDGMEDAQAAVDRIVGACNHIKGVLARITHVTRWEATPYLEGVEMLDLRPGQTEEDGDTGAGERTGNE